MDATELLESGFEWTAGRIAGVTSEDLDGPTTCGAWNLRQLLEHTVETVTLLVDAVEVAGAGGAGAVPGGSSWEQAIAGLAARSRRAWAAPGVMERTFTLSMGDMSGSVVASSILLELVVHGWDISQATGEAAAIPDALAVPILDFARGAIADDARGDMFAADLGLGDTPSDRLVGFLGRKPL
ncbi:MAG TPA: TIGR03086 family metal-binding protein [Acidimicrobiales bacterium]|jgi:uncharacterized protein (TIGR03086 family)|nr:TIGR03086 family metal-binding protein [Acidimicrobiales bacterium]